MRWFALWIAATVSIALGLSVVYLGPSSPIGGKGSGVGSLIISLPLPLILVGLIGVLCSVAGIWWSQSRLPAEAIPAEASSAEATTGVRRHATEVVARVGLALVVAALAGEIFFFVGIVVVPGSHFGASGLAGVIPLVGFGAWPLALGATVINWLAVATSTSRHVALYGVTLGSLTLAWLPGWLLLAAVGFFGGE